MPREISLGENRPLNLEIETGTEGGKVRVSVREAATGKNVWFLLSPDDARGVAADLVEMADDAASPEPWQETRP